MKNTLVSIDNPDLKLWIRANSVPKLKFAPIFMKSGTQDKSDMLIMNIILASV